MQRPHTLARNIAIALTLTVISAPVLADQFNYALLTGLEHSDNINLSETNPTSQNVLIPAVDFSYQKMGSTVQANVVGMVEYRDYLGHAYTNQTLAALTGSLNWSMIPQRLDFVVQDTAAVEPISSFAVNTPNNQQQINVLTLGPTLHYDLGTQLHGQVDVRYINSRASRTRNFNSSRGLAAFHLTRDLNQASNLSLNVQAQRVNFDSVANTTRTNYIRSDIYAQYENTQQYFDVTLVLGRSWLNFKYAPTVSSPMARINLDWRPDTHNTLSLIASRQYTDAATDMLMQVQPIGQTTAPSTNIYNPSVYNPTVYNPQLNTGDAVVNSQAYLVRRIGASYTYSTDLYEVTLSPYYRKLDYPNDPTFNQKNRGGTAGIYYHLNPNLTLSAFGNTEKVDYRTLLRHDRRSNYGISLIDQRTPNWLWRLSFTHRLQHSTQAGLSYQENLIYLGVAYAR